MSGLSTVKWRLTIDVAFTADSADMAHREMDAAARQLLSGIADQGVEALSGEPMGVACKHFERKIELVQ